jgi:hypothetical protein
MMKTCDFCGQWAQWILTWPDGATKLLCRVHKQELETLPSELERKFTFVGAVPSGAHTPER